MSDTPKETSKTTKAARQQHVVAHVRQIGSPPEKLYDEIRVYGTKLEALEFAFGKPDWEYQALAHGQAFGAQS